MLDELTVDIIVASFSVLTAILYIIMYRKREFLNLWVYVAFSNLVANLIFVLRVIDSIYRLIGNIFYLLTGIILGISIIKEYLTMTSLAYQEKNLKQIIYLGIALLISLLSLIFFFNLDIISIIQVILMLFLLFILYLLFLIYKMERSIIHAFMIFTVISAFLVLLFSVFYNNNIERAWETAYTMKIIFITSLFATGLSAPMEDRMHFSETAYRDSYNRAEFYKDLFAHDISNILQSIQSSLDLINFYVKDTEFNNNVKDLGKNIQERIQDASELVSNVRLLSELERSLYPLNNVSVLDITDNVLEIIQKKVLKRPLHIEKSIHVARGDDIIRANKLILNVLENIIDNAIKHNESEAIKIVISVSEEKLNNIEYIRVQISDNGIGIPEHMKEKIFHRSSSYQSDGIGLGLALVKKIIETYDGKIWVENQDESDYRLGSKFIFLLPKIL